MALTAARFFARTTTFVDRAGAGAERVVAAVWRSPAGVPLLHLALLAAIASALYCFGIIRHLPATDNLTAWDIPWYRSISRVGYSTVGAATYFRAYFPLFPYFWRFTHLDELGIALVNAALFLTSFTWLAYQLRLPRRWQLLALSSPLLMFMWVPYTEALFFLFSALLLAGLHQQRTGWVLLGLFGAGLARSASSLFLPSLLLMAALLAISGNSRQAWRWGGGGLLAMVASVAVVATMQWVQTGEAFGFITVHQHWGHMLQIPTLPLMATTGINMLWLEAVALTIGVGAAGLCLALVLRARRRWAERHTLAYPSPAVVFSLGYAVCATLFIVVFQGGNLANLARYIMATPFMVVLLWQLSRLPAWPRATYGYLAVGTALLWPLFGAYTRFPNFTTGQAMWYFGLITGYILAYLGCRQWRYGREIMMVLYVFNVVIQLHLLDGFLQFYLVE